MHIQAAQVEGKHGESDIERIPMIKMSHDKGVNSFLQVYPWLIFVVLDKKKIHIYFLYDAADPFLKFKIRIKLYPQM